MIVPAQIDAGLEALAGVDFTQALAAIRTQDVQGEMLTAEQMIDVIADFIPEAKYAEDALVLLSFIVAGYQSGLIRSAQPEDPAMQRVTGSRAR